MKTTAANASSVKHVHARTVDFVQRFHKLHNHSTPRETVSILTFEYYLSSINDNNNNNNNEKAPRETQKHCARAGCSKVQTPPARLLQRHTQTDRTDYNTLRHWLARSVKGAQRDANTARWL